jgi:hypothetical protein
MNRRRPNPATVRHDDHERRIYIIDSAGVICGGKAGAVDREKAAGDGSAKPPSPVQIRAAPPKSLEIYAVLFLANTIASALVD